MFIGLKKSYLMFYVDLLIIVKGFGVDEVVEIFENYNIENYFVEIGGEMCVKGEWGDGSEWLIVIEKLVIIECVV